MQSDHRTGPIGLHTRGVPIAHRIAEFVKSFEGKGVPAGSLDIGL